MKTQAIIKEPQFMTPGLALADSLRREGNYAEARAAVARELASARDGDARLACAVSLAKVERGAERPALALKIELEAARLADASGDHELRARFHHGLAATYQLLGETDDALIEYEAAAYQWSLAGLCYDAGCAENNVALLLARAGRVAEARAHLARARGYFAGMPAKLAEVDESEAQVYLAEGDPEEALRLVTRSMTVFYEHGEAELRRKALPTLIKAAADCQSRQASGERG